MNVTGGHKAGGRTVPEQLGLKPGESRVVTERATTGILPGLAAPLGATSRRHRIQYGFCRVVSRSDGTRGRGVCLLLLRWLPAQQAKACSSGGARPPQRVHVNALGRIRRHIHTALLGVSFIPQEVSLNMLIHAGANANFKYSLEENIRLQNTLCLREQALKLGFGKAALLRGNTADRRKRAGRKETG